MCTYFKKDYLVFADSQAFSDVTILCTDDDKLISVVFIAKLKVNYEMIAGVRIHSFYNK